MAKECLLFGKRKARGFKYARRGIAKAKKGIGLNITGKTKRNFLQNLKKKRVWVEEKNQFMKLRLSVKGLKTIDKLGLSKALKKFKKKI